MTQAKKYTTQLQAGLGLTQETGLLLDVWKQDMSANELYQVALKSGQFPRISARRLRNVVAECFAPRYLISGGKPASYLQRLRVTLSTGELMQLFLLYTSRANLILADFIREVYWELYAAGRQTVNIEDARTFIRHGLDDGKTEKRWAESTIKRVSSYLTGCCTDYGLLGEKVDMGRLITPFRIESSVAAYLAHNLHFDGLGDNAVTRSSEWQLFGMTRSDVQEELKQLSLKGYFIYQSVSDITHISWKHNSMEEFVDVLAKG